MSDFKVAEQFMRAVCRRRGVQFVDVPVEIVEWKDMMSDPSVDKSTAWNPNSPTFDGERIVIHEPKTLSQTCMAIIGVYVNRLAAITGGNVSVSDPEQATIMTTAAAVIRAFIYEDGALPQAAPETAMRVSLRQFAFVWLLLRDLICPFYRAELKDIDVLCARSATIDVSRYFPKTGDDDSHLELPMIFLNNEVESNVFKQAFLLVDAIRAQGLDASRVVGEIFANDDLRKKVYGLTKLSLIDEQRVVDFLLTLAAAVGMDMDVLLNGNTSNVWIKEATMGGTGPIGGGSMAWFTPPLTETQLDPARGTDNAVARALNPYVQDFWQRVSAEKKRRGKPDFTIEDLLRVQSAGMKPEPGRILQHLLGEQRIW